jgi:energy-coupling factor transporter ATP-binding protein EcfA2
MTHLSVTPQDVKRAQRVDRIIRHTLAARGLAVPLATPLLTRDERLGSVLLWRMNTEHLGRLEAYTSDAVVHQISTNLRGWPVVVCNHTGLAYGVVLGGKCPDLLPAQVEFPGLQRDQFLIGVDANGACIRLPPKELGHMLVVGATGSGKSTFLRLLAHQAIAQDFRLALADLDGRTFPMLAEHPALFYPLANTADDVHRLIEQLNALLEERRRLFSQAPGFPETLDDYNAASAVPLPRVLVVLDEISATVTALGGPRSGFARNLATLGWRARKFGVTLVLAGQDFRKDVVGAIKESLVGPILAFRLATAEAARNVGLPQAIQITQPGRAITDRWGLIQTYHLPKIALMTARAGLTLTERECQIARHLQRHHNGRMSYEALRELGIAEREARRLCVEWDARGWTAKDVTRSNGRYLQSALVALLENSRPSRSGRPDRPNPANLGSDALLTVSEPKP